MGDKRSSFGNPRNLSLGHYGHHNRPSGGERCSGEHSRHVALGYDCDRIGPGNYQRNSGGYSGDFSMGNHIHHPRYGKRGYRQRSSQWGNARNIALGHYGDDPRETSRLD